MTYCLSMTWRLDVSLLNDDLTWHSNTHCVLVTHVDDLTSDIYCVLMSWCLPTHYELMTLTYDTLLYNDSLPIHDLTSLRLSTHRWLDLTFKHPLRVDDSCWWLDIWHSLCFGNLMSAHLLCIDDCCNVRLSNSQRFDIIQPKLVQATTISFSR